MQEHLEVDAEAPAPRGAPVQRHLDHAAQHVGSSRAASDDCLVSPGARVCRGWRGPSQQPGDQHDAEHDSAERPATAAPAVRLHPHQSERHPARDYRALAGTAVGRKHAAKKHYTSSGHGTYESTGQACFGAKWAGTGGWKTSYKETTTVTNVGTTTDTANGHSSYSWDVSEVAGGAACALELLKVPGDKPTGGATWNRGHVRIGSTGSEVQTFPTAPTVTTPCTESMTEPASGGGFSPGGMVLESKGSSLVFKVDLGFPGQGCD